MSGPTKPCTRCGCAEEGKLRNAKPDRWWCEDCVSDYNREYYQKNRERINAKRSRKRAMRRNRIFVGATNGKKPTELKLVDDPLGESLLRVGVCTYRLSEFRGLVKDAYAPTGSVWRDDLGREWRIDGDQFANQKAVLVDEEN